MEPVGADVQNVSGGGTVLHAVRNGGQYTAEEFRVFFADVCQQGNGFVDPVFPVVQEGIAQF